MQVVRLFERYHWPERWPQPDSRYVVFGSFGGWCDWGGCSGGTEMAPKVELRKFGKSLEYHQLYT